MVVRTVVPLFVMLLLATTTDIPAQSGWYQQNSGTSATLYDVFATSTLDCWAVGWQSAILHTSNGGDIWIEQGVPAPGANTGVFFLDDSTGWVVGTGGDILYTTNGGDTWLEQMSGIYVDLWGVYFFDQNNGWAVGGQYYPYFGNLQVILSTSDGGVTWDNPVSELYEPTLRDVFFTDASTGIAVGDGGTVLTTSDGGQTWLEQFSGASDALEDVFFVSPDTGFTVGESGVILRTTDGGTIWDQISSGTSDHLRGTWFIVDTFGWTVGGSESSSVILYTEDAGQTWQPQEPGINTLLRAVHFIDSDHGWAVGVNGVILHTDSGGGTGIEGDHQYSAGPDNVYGLYNYPEPFSTQTTISFTLGIDTHVCLQVFDLYGRLQRILLDGLYLSGEHSVQLLPGDLRSGVYFYRLAIDSEALTGSCVLIR